MTRGSRTTRRSAGIVLLGAAIALSACSGAGDDGAPPATAAPVAATEPARAPVATTPAGSTPAGSTPAGSTPAGSTPASSTPARPKALAGNGTRSAARQLAAYFAAAERADAQLRRAATLVNGGMTKDALRIRPEAVRAIEAAAPQKLRATVPAGMPPPLMRSVLLTYSELASRYYAMRFVVEAGDPRRDVVVRRGREISPTLAEIVDALGNGAPAARRFGTDLADAEALARTTAPLPARRARSRAAAEVSVRLAHITTANGCCLETGGSVFTALAPVSWTGGHDRRSYTGKVGGIGFRVDWTGRRWDTQLEAG